MDNYKCLKDPIYGYINIPKELVSGIIDTACFQRLRKITQTSYEPLYASSVHNRFVHSLGVYYLSTLASESLVSACERLVDAGELDCNKADFVPIDNCFKLASLLHDIGHAPFSHTGENFYLGSSKKYNEINSRLVCLVETESFDKDIPVPQYAAPHEIMSAIIGIKEYGEFIDDKEFFARCITGYQYKDLTDKNKVKNCFIQMLNSSIIDVDKLDYLSRDAYTTGYDTVKIDYERLLKAVTIVKQDENVLLAFNKSAISVIENVIYAHDSERKWIQSHPMILYENYLLQKSFEYLEKKLNNSDSCLFSEKALSKKGTILNKNVKVCLLCDDDLIHLMKSEYNNVKYIEEYFDRHLRYHPIWKSEAEYNSITSLIGKEGDITRVLNDTLKAIAVHFQNTINESLVCALESDIDRLEKNVELCGLKKADIKAQKTEKQHMLAVCKALLSYAKEEEYNGDFIILKSNQFNSGFNKPDFGKIRVAFSEDKVNLFTEVVPSFDKKTNSKEDMFYIFYNKYSVDKEIIFDGRELWGKLIQSLL